VSMSSGDQLLQNLHRSPHVVQLHPPGDHALAVNVGNYLHEGLRAGDGLLVIATPDHRRAFLKQLKSLGADPDRARRDQQLVCLDSQETLARFTIDRRLVWDKFEAVIRAAVASVKTGAGCGIRAYGDMVGVLWQAGERTTAIQLEEFWNRLRTEMGMHLFCAYPIDIFGQEAQSPEMHDLLCAHTHLLPVSENGDLRSAIHRASEEVAGKRGTIAALSSTCGIHSDLDTELPGAEAAILSLRTTIPEYAEEILARTREYFNSEKRFRALVENSSDAIALFDLHGRISYASASTGRVLGWLPEQLEGADPLTFIHPENVQQVKQALGQAIARPRHPVRLETRVRRNDGRWSWVESTLTNFLDEPDIRAVVANYRDVGDRKVAEEEKEQHTKELARSNEHLQSFAYAATHDLKEPLRTVSICTDLLMQNTQLDANGKQLATFILDGMKRMSALLDDLLAFASLNGSDPVREVNLEAAAEQAVQNLAHAINASEATVTVHSLPTITAVEGQVVALFQNLIGNAIKYRGSSPPRVEVGSERLDDVWLVKVKDNGIGIAPEYRDQVFGLFKRLHGRDIPGTGIGLALCKRIVEGMNSKIWVESAVGQGSTFCFTLPAGPS
jgi:PAS domain S-box-containing protein